MVFYLYEYVRIVDIRIQMQPCAHKYAPNYYEVTITYTYKEEDNNQGGWVGVPYLS